MYYLKLIKYVLNTYVKILPCKLSTASGSGSYPLSPLSVKPPTTVVFSECLIIVGLYRMIVFPSPAAPIAGDVAGTNQIRHY